MTTTVLEAPPGGYSFSELTVSDRRRNWFDSKYQILYTAIEGCQPGPKVG